MREYFYQLYHWNKHLWWFIYKMVIAFIILDFHNGVDAYYWIRIHLSYKGKFIKHSNKVK